MVGGIAERMDDDQVVDDRSAGRVPPILDAADDRVGEEPEDAVVGEEERCTAVGGGDTLARGEDGLPGGIAGLGVEREREESEGEERSESQRQHEKGEDD
jgi:hypothetical protein